MYPLMNGNSRTQYKLLKYKGVHIMKKGSTGKLSQVKFHIPGEILHQCTAEERKKNTDLLSMEENCG